MKNDNIFEIKYKEQGVSSQRRYPNESFIAFLAQNFFSIKGPQRKEIKVLELGCGSGANIWMVAKEGFDAHGLDISATGVEYCHQICESWGVAAKLKVGDMTRIDYSSNNFDFIYDVVSMQHLTHLQHTECYKEIYRCLKPGGKFYSYHLGENSTSYKVAQDRIDHCTIKNIPDGFPLANNGQTCFLSTNEARNMLGQSGFTEINIEKILRTYENQTQQIEYLSISSEKPKLP